MGTVISDLLRNVFMFLDSIVYSVIGKVYELFIAIANTNIFADGTINEFANRVYALLAIFMLFRLSFSVLTYIINPDNINDKSAGGGKLIGNILITIILLISVPWLFQQVMKIQGDLLNDNIIGKIILGVNGDPNNQDVQDKIEQSISSQLNAGDTMAWTTFSAFFSLTDECAALPKECTVNFPKMTGTDNAYDRIKKSQLVSGIKDSGLATVRTESGEYVFEYLPIISTIAGGFIAYILLLFCFQIAVRSVKLGVLQLIAPIPVISYLDPKQGKDGMFKKWLKICGKTFADLFIRLAAIYFAIFIITEITNGRGMIDITTGDTQTSLLVKVLIILGALMFAKELPKFIEEITGIKLDGGFSLNPFKNNAILGGIAGGVVGAGMGAIGGFAGNLMAGNGIGNAFRGFGKGLISGGAGGIKDKGLKKDTFTRGAKAGVATGTNYANWKATGSTARGRMSAKLSSVVGAKSPLQKMDDEIKAYEDFGKEAGDLFTRANGEMIKHNYGFTDSNGNRIDMRHFKAEKERLNILRNKKLDVVRQAGESDIDYQNRVSAAETAHAQEVSNLNDWINKTEKKAEQAYIDEVKAGRITDGDITATLGKMQQIVSENSSYEGFAGVNISSGADIKAAKDSLSTKKNEVQKSDKYNVAKADQQAVKEAKANK